MWLMRSPMCFEKISILKVVVSSGGAKAHLGKKNKESKYHLVEAVKTNLVKKIIITG